MSRKILESRKYCLTDLWFLSLQQDLVDRFIMIDSEEKFHSLFNFEQSHHFGLRYVTEHLAPVVRRLDNVIHWINFYPVDNAVRFAISYLPDSVLSVG